MEDGTMYAIPISKPWASEDLTREVVEFFLDWEKPPSRMRVEMIQDGQAIVRCWDGQESFKEVVG